MTKSELTSIASSIRRERKSGSLRHLSPEMFANTTWIWVVALSSLSTYHSIGIDYDLEWFAKELGLEYDQYEKVWVEAQPILTTREMLVNILVQHALPPIPAEMVVVSVLDIIEAEHKICWDSPSDTYPPELYYKLWLIVKKATIKWIDENKPDAWFRTMFIRDENAS